MIEWLVAGAFALCDGEEEEYDERADPKYAHAWAGENGRNSDGTQA